MLFLQRWWQNRGTSVSMLLGCPLSIVGPFYNPPLPQAMGPSERLYLITDPLPHTMPTWPSTWNVWTFSTAHAWCSPLLVPLPVAPLAWLHILDGQMIYVPHHFTLSISSQSPNSHWPITSHCTMQSGTCGCFTADEPCAWFLIIIYIYIACI